MSIPMSVPMTPRQQAGVARMIVEITEVHGCVLEIEDDEVTVSDGRGGAHAHHRGPNLYERMVRALATSKAYAASRRDTEVLG